MDLAEFQYYKCPNCSGSIKFDSASQSLKCPFCDTEFNIATLKEYDEVLKEDGESDLDWGNLTANIWNDEEAENMRIFTCQACSGEIIGDKEMGATSCPYCGNAVVLPSQFKGELRPDYIIPFKKSKDEAKAALKQHYAGKRFLPKVFKDQNHIEEIKGIYVPFWLFDAEVEASGRFKGVKSRTWSDTDYRYTEEDFYSLSRNGRFRFDNVAIDGSSKLDNTLMESIEAFDFSAAVEFKTPYLAGYLADRYDVKAEECVARANERIENSAEQLLRESVTGYEQVTRESVRLKLHNAKAKYALYPVWLLNTTWKGDRYTFAMNGQTGKFVGDLPADSKLYRAWFAGIALVTAAAVLGVQALAWFL